MILDSIARAKPGDQDTELFDLTLKEASVKGWLQSPHTPRQVDAMMGARLPVRRFCAMWKGKLRTIDDFKENLLNKASRPELFSECELALVDRGQRHRGDNDSSLPTVTSFSNILCIRGGEPPVIKPVPGLRRTVFGPFFTDFTLQSGAVLSGIFI